MIATTSSSRFVSSASSARGHLQDGERTRRGVARRLRLGEQRAGEAEVALPHRGDAQVVDGAEDALRVVQLPRPLQRLLVERVGLVQGAAAERQVAGTEQQPPPGRRVDIGGPGQHVPAHGDALAELADDVEPHREDSRDREGRTCLARLLCERDGGHQVLVLGRDPCERLVLAGSVDLVLDRLGQVGGPPEHQLAGPLEVLGRRAARPRRSGSSRAGGSGPPVVGSTGVTSDLSTSAATRSSTSSRRTPSGRSSEATCSAASRSNPPGNDEDRASTRRSGVLEQRVAPLHGGAQGLVSLGGGPAARR